MWHLECIYNGWQVPRRSRPGFPSICSIRRSPFPVAGLLRGIQKLQRSHIQFWGEKLSIKTGSGIAFKPGLYFEQGPTNGQELPKGLWWAGWFTFLTPTTWFNWTKMFWPRYNGDVGNAYSLSQHITFQTKSKTFWNTLDQLYHWGGLQKTWLHYLKNNRKSCGLITVKWVLNWMSPNISLPPYFIDSLLFCKQNQNCKYFRYSWRPNYINNSCHWEFHKTTLSTVPHTCMNQNNSTWS